MDKTETLDDLAVRAVCALVDMRRHKARRDSFPAPGEPGSGPTYHQRLAAHMELEAATKRWGQLAIDYHQAAGEMTMKTYKLEDVKFTIGGQTVEPDSFVRFTSADLARARSRGISNRLDAGDGTGRIGTDQAELEALPAPTATVELIPLDEAAAGPQAELEARPIRMKPITFTEAELEAAAAGPSVVDALHKAMADQLEADLCRATGIPRSILFGPVLPPWRFVPPNADADRFKIIAGLLVKP